VARSKAKAVMWIDASASGYQFGPPSTDSARTCTARSPNSAAKNARESSLRQGGVSACGRLRECGVASVQAGSREEAEATEVGSWRGTPAHAVRKAWVVSTSGRYDASTYAPAS